MSRGGRGLGAAGRVLPLRAGCPFPPEPLNELSSEPPGDSKDTRCYEHVRDREGVGGEAGDAQVVRHVYARWCPTEAPG